MRICRAYSCLVHVSKPSPVTCGNFRRSIAIWSNVGTDWPFDKLGNGFVCLDLWRLWFDWNKPLMDAHASLFWLMPHSQGTWIIEFQRILRGDELQKLNIINMTNILFRNNVWNRSQMLMKLFFLLFVDLIPKVTKIF